VALSVVSIHAYVRWRRRPRSRWLVLSLVAFALAALGGEVAVAVPAWVVAWELTMSRGPARERAMAAAPLVVAALVYLGLYGGFGFGVSHSGIYSSPLTDPIGFLLGAVPERLPLLAAATLTPIPSEISMMATPAGAAIASLVCAVVTVVFLAFMLPLIRRDRTVRFALVAAVFSLVPVCGTFTHNRVLLLPTVATAWVIGCWLDDFTKEWFHARERQFRPLFWRRAGAWVIVVMHVAVPLTVWPASTLVMRSWSTQEHDVAVQGGMAEVDEDDLVLALNMPDQMGVLHLAVLRHLQGLPDPAGLHILTQTPAEQRLVRTGERSFTLEARQPGYLRTLMGGLYRSEPVAEGDLFDAYSEVGLTVRADRVEDGDVLRFEVELDRSIDSPDAVLLAWDGERMARFEPPPVGGCVLVPFTNPQMPLPAPPDWPSDACDGTTDPQ
jgi:hypothetical protein